MHPIGLVETAQDQVGDVDQARRVLPAAGLIAPHKAAQDAPIADAIVELVDRSGIERGHGHVFADQVDVLVPLDQVLGDPGRAPVAGRLVGQLPLGRGDRVVVHPVVWIVADDLYRVLPLGRGEFAGVRVRQPELPHILKVLYRGVHPKALKSLQVADPIEVFIEVIPLPLVHGHRQPIRLTAIERNEHSFFRVHLSSPFPVPPTPTARLPPF